MCITCVYYSVLVKIVCSIHVFALYVDIQFVLLLLSSLTFIHVLEGPCKPMGLGHDVISHYVFYI